MTAALSRIFAGWLPNGWQNAVRMTFAALLALYLAYWLELDSPQSAAITVLIVAGPMHGMVISKSLYRLGGSLVGGFAAVVLMALFAQTPEMFVLAVGVWMGLCTAVSTLLRNFRSYGAVLAGYTVALIVFPATTHPDQVFSLVVSRLSVVGLGVLCSAIVTSLTTPRAADRVLERSFRAALKDLAEYAIQALDGSDARTLAETRRALAARLSAMDSQVEFAAAETSEMSRLSEVLRASVAAMLGSLTAVSAAHQAGFGKGADEARELLAALAAVAHSNGLDALAQVTAVRDGLRALSDRLEEELQSTRLPELLAHDRLIETLDELAVAAEGLLALLGGRVVVRPVDLGVHRDLRWAAVNGVRAAILVWLTAALWLGSGWSGGGVMETIIIPNAGLLAMRDRPDLDTTNFMLGLVIASVLGWVYLIEILPNISGFPLLALAFTPVILTAALLMTRPRHVFVGVGIAVFFLTLIEPRNHMTYNPTHFLEMAMACLAGAMVTVAAFRVILPLDQRRHVRMLVLAIRADLRALIAGRAAIHRTTWETRMHDRLLRLGGRLRAAGMAQNGVMAGGFAALRLGRETLRIQALSAGLGRHGAVSEVVAPALATLRATAQAPAETIQSARRAAERLMEMAAAETPARATILARLAASFTEIALLIGRYRRFLLASQEARS